MLVRKALPEDAHAIATIHVRSWQAAYRGIVPSSFLDGLSIPRREEYWRQQLQSDETITFLAEDRRQVLGWAQLGPSRDADADLRTGELYATYVAPEQWRQGVGQHLWNASVVHLRRAALAVATLWVLQQNTGAYAFYRANGFVVDVGVEKLLRVAGVELSEIRLRYSIDG